MEQASFKETDIRHIVSEIKTETWVEEILVLLLMDPRHCRCNNSDVFLLKANIG